MLPDCPKVVTPSGTRCCWTNIQALAYDAEGMKLASAPCIAYQALCGAVLASYALGMLP